MESLGLSSITEVPDKIYEAVLSYNQEIKEKPEQSQKRTLILTVALAVIAAIGAAFAVSKGSLAAAIFTPLIVLYSQASVLSYSLKLKPTDKIDERIALDQKNIIRWGLIGLTVLGAPGIAAALHQKLYGFAALFALLTAGTGAAAWHEQGMIVTKTPE